MAKQEKNTAKQFSVILATVFFESLNTSMLRRYFVELYCAFAFFAVRYPFFLQEDERKNSFGEKKQSMTRIRQPYEE